MNKLNQINAELLVQRRECVGRSGDDSELLGNAQAFQAIMKSLVGFMLFGFSINP